MLRLLAPQLAHPNLVGVVTLLAICAAGAAAYALLGALVGIVKLSELRSMVRRQAGVTAVDPGEQP